MRTLELPLFFSFLVVDIVAGFTASPFRSSSCGLSVLQVPHVGVPQAQRPARRKLKLNVLSASEDDIDDGIDEYKMELAEFMARAHEKRLEAMDAVKAEVQRGFEEQIAELQSKVHPGVLCRPTHTILGTYVLSCTRMYGDCLNCCCLSIDRELSSYIRVEL